MSSSSGPSNMNAKDVAMQQTTELPLLITKDLCTGRTYIVTGANVGLGLEAARHLVQIGAAKVVMAVRSLEAGNAAKADIEASTGISGVAEVWQLDLASYASVQTFAEKAISNLKRIDAVIENAAVASGAGQAEGHRLTITVNVISTLLLAVLLLPKLRADAKAFGYTPRLCIVTSGTAFDMADVWSKIANNPIAEIDGFEDLALKVYPTSKLMEILAVREIARRLPVNRGGVIINLINPGLCATSLSRNAPPAFKEELKKMLDQRGRTAECGSRTLTAAAVSGEASHGSYMNDCYPANHLVPSFIDAKADGQAWESIAAELDKIQPNCVAKALA